MKKLLWILVLGLLWCTPSFSDDIRDFEIEGISLKKNLTFLDIEKIFKKFEIVKKDFDNTSINFFESGEFGYPIIYNLVRYSNWKKGEFKTLLYYTNLADFDGEANDNDGRVQYEVFSIKKNLKVFDELQIVIAGLEKKDSKQLISIAGIYDFDSIKKCIDTKKEIEDSIVDMFKGAKRGKDKYTSHNLDTSGRSRILETYFAVNNNATETWGYITLYCYDWDRDIIERHNWKNKLVLNINLSVLKLHPQSETIALHYNTDKQKKVFEQISFIKKNKKFHTDDKYYALLIANSDYENWDKLKSPTNDVDAISSELINNYGFEVEILKDADRDGILNKLYEYKSKISDNDNLLIYYAGHGELLSNNNAFWIPQDGTKEISSNWLNTSDVNSAISLIKAKDLLVMVDSCYQGTAFKGNEKNIENEKIQSKDDEYFKKMVSYRSAVVITSGNNEIVVDALVDNHSPFAYKFLDILKKNDKFETGTSLYSAIKRYHSNLSQNPNIIRKVDWHDLGGEFVFVKKK